MCEKPLAPTLAEAQQCVNTLGDRAGKVFLAFNRRFDPGHAAVKQAIENGSPDPFVYLAVERDTGGTVDGKRQSGHAPKVAIGDGDSTALQPSS